MDRAKGVARLLAGVATLSLLVTGSAWAESAPDKPASASSTTEPSDQTGKADPQAAAAQEQASGIAEGSDVIVTATKPNEIAPVTASLQTTQPQSIISRSFIEDSLPATADFNQIALISPSVSNYGAANGTGLSESKAQIRGFQDGEYNITYDGVPFGDTNDPSHHSNTFFPSNTIETLIVDRGPGNASQLGIATFGGNFNLFSRATRADPSLEFKGTYGTYDTYLLRGLAQTGAIDRLGGTEAVFSAQHIGSHGARTYSPFHSNNVFGKIVVPIGPAVRLTVLGTYNENSFNQPDKDGATLSQIAQYGRYFSLNNDLNSQNYYKYNYTHKTTDFEIVKLEVQLAPHSTFENRTYTYSYDNETLSGNDATLFATATPAQIAAADVVTITPAVGMVKAVTGFGVPGYTKANRYRVYGDIAKTRIDFGFGALTAGAWLERADTYRQQRDVNLVNLMPNLVEKAVTNPVTGAATPQNIKFDQESHTNHTEEFAELELRPFRGVTVTPGFKHVDFNREIRAAYNQTTRYAQNLNGNYAANLPFATINYQATDRLSAYAQYARGFLAPPLSVLYIANPTFSTVQPERSTNYQAGVVYHGRALSLDVDVYKIDFKNKFAVDPTAPASEGVVYVNQGAVQYKGVEGQATYALPVGLALFVNGSRNYAKTDNPGAPRRQVANAPEWTAAGGILYKHGPARFSLIDKYLGPQGFADPTSAVYDAYRASGYNSAILSARYDLRRIQFGVEVQNLFDAKHVTNIAPSSKTPAAAIGQVAATNFDQYLYQTGRAFTGDVTVRF